MPRSGIYMIAFGYCDDRRFARVFRETWLKLPLWVRRRMLKHWREYKAAVVCLPELRRQLDVPSIEVLDDKSDWHRGPSGCAAGQTSIQGTSLSFWAEVVDRLPDEHLQTFIAHELAHVHLMTHNCHHTDDYSLAESEVSEALDEWGFDEGAMWIWQEENWPEYYLD